MGRVKCDVLDRNRERELNRIATKGVVKFFNVCNNQQKEIETKIKMVGPSEHKKDKILSTIDKGSFLDKLKKVDVDEENEDVNFIDSNQNKQHNASKKTQNAKPSWSVLRDDFIMGGKIKDWDKNNDKSGNDSDESDD